MGIPDTGRVTLHVEKGVVHVRTSAACIGQGIGTITCQIVCEVTGLRPDQVTWDTPDTSIAPNSGNTTASRQTLFTGEATRRAATELKWALEGRDLSAVEGVDFHQEYTGITDKLGSPRPNPISHIAYGYATHLVELDDDGKIKRVIAAHDVGRAVNPVSVEGQIEGGVVMSLGYALTEDFPLKDGTPHGGVRLPGPVPGQPDPRREGHYCGEEPLRAGLRRQGHRRDLLHPPPRPPSSWPTTTTTASSAPACPWRIRPTARKRSKSVS